MDLQKQRSEISIFQQTIKNYELKINSLEINLRSSSQT